MKRHFNLTTVLSILITVITITSCHPTETTSTTIPITENSNSEKINTDQASDMISKYLHSQALDLAKDYLPTLEEVTPPSAWEELQLQVFRVTDEPYINETFLIYDGQVFQLGTAFGGHGVTSMSVSDLNQNNKPELVFTYSFGSGIHQSRIAVFAPEYTPPAVYEANKRYYGDIMLFSETPAEIGVRVIELVEERKTIEYHDTLGYIKLSTDGENPQLTLETQTNLPAEVEENIFDMK